MYINIGQNVILSRDGILGVFDLDTSTGSHLTRKFLAGMEKKGRVINAAEDIPRSFVLYRKREETIVYLSQYSSQTLYRRSQTPFFESQRMDMDIE
ncbi:MAG: DUF370 domain-containing protein [Oscillospiraceae bacterium]|nr:DUF370 domain-containing protein [Oscillospiraceae bacterium]MCR5175172.1 DUF370 domain-containing protein [Oscillospiraceae bacterium]